MLRTVGDAVRRVALDLGAPRVHVHVDEPGHQEVAGGRNDAHLGWCRDAASGTNRLDVAVPHEDALPRSHPAGHYVDDADVAKEKVTDGGLVGRIFDRRSERVARVGAGEDASEQQDEKAGHEGTTRSGDRE